MQIKRDYSQPFFGQRRQRRNLARPLFFIGLLAGMMLVYVYVNLDTLQETTLELIGQAPTPTPMPGDLATEAAALVLVGNLDAAADLFERALAQRPDNIDYLYEYGQMLIDKGDAEIAAELGERILTINPGDARGYVLNARALAWGGNSAGAIPIALAGLDLGGGYTSELYSVLARAYANTGRYNDGVNAGLTAVQEDVGNVDARRSYAYALSWVGANDAAIEQLEAAIALDPNRLPAYFELALQYLARDRDQEAIDLYDRILAVQPRNARALLRLCETYRKVGQFERAIGFCEDAVSADPTSSRAQYQLGILYYNRFNFPGALEAFTNCAEIDPSSLECTYRQGLSHYYVDQCDEAWDVLQRSLVMASERSGVDSVVNNIRLGLIAIGQKCPEYSALAPSPDELPDDIAGEIPDEFEDFSDIDPDAFEDTGELDELDDFDPLDGAVPFDMEDTIDAPDV